MNGLQFFDKTHRYKLDGEWVPGVTTILNVLDKPAISKWAARVVAEYVADNRVTVEGLYAAGRGPMVAMLKETPWQQMRTAGERGTSFHDFAERISNGEEVDVPEPMVPLVENALRFMDDWRIEPVLVEAAVGSREHRYAGKLDLAATYRNPVTHEAGIGIFDWKSGKRIYAGAAFQMNAYGHAEFHGQRGDEHPLPPITAAFGVHIREDDYDVHELPYGPGVFEEFLTIRKVYDINKRAEGNWREAGSGYVGAAIRDQEIAS